MRLQNSLKWQLPQAGYSFSHRHSSSSVVPSNWSDFSHVKRVGVIGAGVAGLQVAKSMVGAGLKARFLLSD